MLLLYVMVIVMGVVPSIVPRVGPRVGNKKQVDIDEIDEGIKKSKLL